MRVSFQIRYKCVSDIFTEYSGETGLKLDPQYTILVLRLVDWGVEVGAERHLSCVDSITRMVLFLINFGNN